MGTMTFGGKGRFAAIGNLGQAAVDELMKTAVDAGINFIDTANVYSEGLSEELTGQSIVNLGLHRDDLVIATKVRSKTGEGPNDSGLTRKYIFQELDKSLKRLQVDYIDLYQIHGYDAITPIEETLDALDQLVQSGKVRYIGASNLAAWQLMQALSYSKYNHKARFESLQAYYTIAGRDLERELAPLMLHHGVGMMVWSPLAGGILSGKYTRSGEAAAGSRRVNFDFPPVDKEKAYDIVDGLTAMAKEKNATVPQLALAWLLHQKVVTTVIIGAKDPAQLSDNLKSVDIVFTPQELSRLDELSKLKPEYPGWMLAFQGADRQP